MKSTAKLNTSPIIPPKAGATIFADIRNFFIHKPSERTLVKFNNKEEREIYCKRIMQRLGIDVESYSVLNVHKIGLDVPVHYVFDELLQWSGDSTCWPNHLAHVHLLNNRLEEIEIHLFGRKFYPFGLFSPLFRLDAIRIQRIPATSDYDNARYLLYKCSGGYPIGVFSMYVRTSIPNENEIGQAQLFMAVGFDFYGRKSPFRVNPVNFFWEMIHDRVTTNTLNRFKQLCEWRFQKIQNGIGEIKH
ncbi:MAG: hypothetical protein K9H16_13085 [Bacteroidales bacterium]|nr:hypothetical protein [Bacteroidales bacterium]